MRTSTEPPKLKRHSCIYICLMAEEVPNLLLPQLNRTQKKIDRANSLLNGHYLINCVNLKIGESPRFS